MNGLPLARPADRRRDSGWLVAAGALFLALVVGYFSYLNRGFQLDDALIYHRYVRNVLAGEGLVYNPGERLNALTSPLFTYLSIGCAALLGDVQAASTVVAGSTLLLALYFWWRLLALVSGPVSGFLAAVLAAGFPYLFKVYGMETPLFLLLVAACLYFFETRKDVWLGAACGLLLLTRGEGVLLLLPLAAEYWRQRRPLPRARAFVAPVVMLAGHYLFSALYFGALLPHTAMVKIHQGRSGLWGPWPPFARAGYQIDWFFDGRSDLVVLLVILASLGAAASRRTTLFRVGGAFLLLYTAFYVLLSLPNYHWYYAPYYMFGYAWAGVGIGWLWSRASSLRRRLFRGLVAAALVALTVYLVARGASSTWSSVRRAGGVPGYRQIGSWLAENAPPEATVAAMEIGMIGWHSRRYIIDIVGLVTPENARLLAEKRFDDWLELRRPDYVVTHRPEWRMERVMQAAVRRGEYRPVAALSPAGLRLLEKNPYFSVLGSVAASLAELAHRPDPERRALVIEAITAGFMGPTVPLGGDGVRVANLRSDRWTRATQPAGLVVRNDQARDKLVELRLSCPAPAEVLPVTAFVDDGEGVRTIVFSESGSRDVELPPVPPGQQRLFILWADKAWRPGSQDRRRLGIHLARLR